MKKNINKFVHVSPEAKAAIRKTWQEGEMAISMAHFPTQFKVYLTPVEVNGRWRIRCGKNDYVDTPVTAPKQKLNIQPAAPAPASTNKEPQPVKPVTQE